MSQFLQTLTRSSLRRPTSSLARTLFTARPSNGAAASAPSGLSSTAPSLLSWPVTQVTTLKNGLRVATEETGNGNAETATVGIWVDTGSRYENDRNNGAAHFIEHMLFKGTERRTRQQLELEVENLGGHLNAYTSRESTVFYSKVFKEHIAQAVDLLSDIFVNSKFDPEDIERERHTILREMKEVDNQLHEVIFDRLHQTAYRGTALSRTILGSQNHVETLTRQDLTEFKDTHYTPNRMVIAAAGAVKHEDIVKLADKAFGHLPAQSSKLTPFKEPAKFTGSDILIRYDDMPLAHVTLGFATAGWTDPDNFPLMIIQTMLGSWEKSVRGGIHSSSALVSAVAQYELAHSVSAFNTQYSDTGLFGIYAVAEPTTLNNLTYAMTKSINELCYNVDESLLAEAKNQLKMTMLSHLDGSTAIAEDIGRQLLTYGRRMHPVEMIARIDAVDAAAVKLCARRFFHDRDHALAAIGPIYELPDYNWIRSRSYSSII